MRFLSWKVYFKWMNRYSLLGAQQLPWTSEICPVHQTGKNHSNGQRGESVQPSQNEPDLWRVETWPRISPEEKHPDLFGLMDLPVKDTAIYLIYRSIIFFHKKIFETAIYILSLEVLYPSTPKSLNVVFTFKFVRQLFMYLLKEFYKCSEPSLICGSYLAWYLWLNACSSWTVKHLWWKLKLVMR